MEKEIWKEIEGYEDYFVSNFGMIKSFKGKDINGNILSQSKNSSGYFVVKLYKNGKPKPERIHNLLFETFNNIKLKKNECIHHIDKNPLNNNLNNLQKMTNSEHISLHHKDKIVSEKSKQLMSETRKEKFKNGELNQKSENNSFYGKKHSEESKKLTSEKMSGENGPNVKLINQQVIEIRESNLSQIKLAKLYKVHPATISLIKNNKTWKHK